MSVIYVAHEFGGKQENYEKAKKITHDLQVQHPSDCFICPLMAFSHLTYNEIGYNEELEICLDLMCVCDKLLVVSNISDGVQKEIDFAKLIDMETEYI